MEMKVLLLREDGETKIWCKRYDKDGNIDNREFSISYDEWDAVQKKRLDKNIWLLDIPESEQDKRLEWILQPQRMILVLRALSGNKIDDIGFFLGLGTVLEEYQSEFRQSPLQFIQDARKAKEVFEYLLTK